MFGIGAAIGPIVGLSLWAVVGSANTWWIMSLLTFVGLALALAGVRQSVLAKAERPAVQPNSPIWNRITHRLRRRNPRAPEGVSVRLYFPRQPSKGLRWIATHSQPNISGRRTGSVWTT